MGATVAVGAGEDVVLVRRAAPVAMRAYLPHTDITVTVNIFVFFFSSLLVSSLELSDAKVYEP